MKYLVTAMGLVKKVFELGVLLAEVYVDTVGDPEKYGIKLTEKFPGIKFVVAKKVDGLYPVVSGASTVAKVNRDRALRNWVFDETAQNMHMNTESGYPGDPGTKQWIEDHKHPVFGFPTSVRFSWGTCTSYFKDGVEVTSVKWMLQLLSLQINFSIVSCRMKFSEVTILCKCLSCISEPNMSV